ncbi:hypothetical protein ACFLUU_03020 [Chloroflexota bacterium]
MRYERLHMRPRVYVILDVTAGKADWVAQTLRMQSGVLLADEIEELTHVVLVLEAPSRQKLAESTIKALSSVESATDDVQLLPANNRRSGAVANKFSFPACVKRGDLQRAFESS